MSVRPVLAIVGGTGAQGGGLALRWAAAGHTVIVGSRSGQRARDAAAELNRRLPGASIEGLANEAAHVPPDGSAATTAQRLLGERVSVVAAFQNVSAHHLNDLDREIACDVLVCGDDPAAKETVRRLARDAGFRTLDAMFWSAAMIRRPRRRSAASPATPAFAPSTPARSPTPLPSNR
jgi:predicted dinucleotide-binding enzyme